jgi:hypothetical protein
VRPAYVMTQPNFDAGLANPDFKLLAQAIMRSQKCIRPPDMGGKCDGKEYCHWYSVEC